MVSEKVISLIVWAIIIVLCVATGRFGALLLSGWSMQW